MPKCSADHEQLGRLLGNLHGLIEEDVCLPCVVDLHRLRRLLVRVAVEQVLDSLEYGVELLHLLFVLAVIGVGDDAATEDVQILKGHHHGLAGRRTLNDLLAFPAQTHHVFENQLALGGRQYKRHIFVGLNTLLPHGHGLRAVG